MDFLSELYQEKILPTVWRNRSTRIRAISITAVVLLAVVYRVYRKITVPPKSLRHIPTIDNIRLLRDIFAGKPIGVFAEEVTIPAGLNAPNGLYLRSERGGWTVRIQDPVAIKKLLLNTDIFPKNVPPSRVVGTLLHRLLLGPNILMTNGEEWKMHRKIANPAFHRSTPVELFGFLANKTLKIMDGMGKTVDFSNLMTRLTLDAIGLAAFGFNFHAIDDANSEWVLRYNGFMRQIANPLYLMFPILERRFLWLFPGRKKAHDDLSAFLQMLDTVIEHKRQLLKNHRSPEKDHEKDLLTLMIENEDRGEGGLTNEQLKSDLCVFFVAGHDTTSSALAFAAYYLAKNPDIQEKARQEALSVLGDYSDDVMPTLEQVKSMKYITCIIKETLRIMPPIGSSLLRVAAKDTELNGVFIPKGTKLGIDVYETHHNPRFWKDPDVFNPDRFADGGEASEKSASDGYFWVPFGNGSRQCLGMNFSLVEQSVLLPLLLRKYEWTLPEDSIHKDRLMSRGIGLLMVKDLQIAFKKRSVA